jgi:FdhE protein
MPTLEKQRQQFQKRLKMLKDEEGIPQALLTLLESVAQKQFHVLEQEALSQREAPRAEELTSVHRHVQGASLLPRAMFPVPGDLAAVLMGDILGDVKLAGGELGRAAELIQEALDHGDLEPERIFQAYLGEDHDFFTHWAEKTPAAPKLLYFLAQSSLSPYIQSIARHVESLRPREGAWGHGHCPICGSLPYISRLETREGLRTMHCSFCHCAYRVSRIGCAYCGEQDHEKLRYFDVEEKSGYRVDLCDQCKMYIKTADFRQLDKPSLPALDDLESLALDVLAQSRGYVRPILSAWGF